MSEKNSNRRLPLAKSILVWVAGAVLGWVVTVISVYYVIRTDSMMASKETTPPTAVGEQVKPGEKNKLAKEKQEQLEPVEPAAGPEPAEPPPENGVGEPSPQNRPGEPPPENGPGTTPESR